MRQYVRPSPAGAGPGEDAIRRRSRPRRALVAAFIGNAVEWYDFAIFGAFAIVLADVFFPVSERTTGLALTFGVLATSFVARPLGAILIGTRADRLGRRRALVAMIALMSVATAAIGLMPAPTGAGLVAPALLLLFRLLQGFSAGGEITSSVPFMLEHAPPRQRGRYSGWHTAGVAVGLSGGFATVALLSTALGSQDIEAGGWRVAFLLAIPLGLVGLYLRLRLDEPPPFRTLTEKVRPRRLIAELLHEHGPACRRGFVAVAALTLTFNVWFVFLPSLVATRTTASLGQALGCAVLGLVSAAVMSPIAGRLSDRIGRRPLMLAGTLTISAAAVPAFWLATSGSPLLMVLSNVTVGAAIGMLVVPAFVAEPFPTELRATGVALTYGLASALFGGTAPLVATVLASALPDIAIPVYVAGASGLAFAATMRAPETAFARLGGSSRALPATRRLPDG